MRRARRRGHVDAETVERRRQADSGAAVHDGPHARRRGDARMCDGELDLPRGGEAFVVREDRRAVAQVVVRNVDGLGQARYLTRAGRSAPSRRSRPRRSRGSTARDTFGHDLRVEAERAAPAGRRDGARVPPQCAAVVKGIHDQQVGTPAAQDGRGRRDPRRRP